MGSSVRGEGVKTDQGGGKTKKEAHDLENFFKHQTHSSFWAGWTIGKNQGTLERA